jgi:hypothetical protein
VRNIYRDNGFAEVEPGRWQLKQQSRYAPTSEELAAHRDEQPLNQQVMGSNPRQLTTSSN